MKLLYIEDNQIDIDLTLRALKKSAPDIETTVVRSLAEAFTIIKSSDFAQYDIVLTDMQLQDGDGLSVLSHIRGYSLEVSVVILTGQGDEKSAVAALKAGADDYLIKKPGYLNELPKLLGEALEAYRKTEDYAARSLRLLYLEHNKVDIDLTRRHLKKHAPHILLDTISTAGELYHKVAVAAKAMPYSALLLDYRLPKENAFEILREIKSSSIKDLPVILVTGKGDEEIAVKALKLGAFDYVTKDQGYLYRLPSIVENAYYNAQLAREHQALVESEKRYRGLFENNHVAMLLIDPSSGKILDANSAATALYGWAREELLAKRIHEINTMQTDPLNNLIAQVVDKEENHFLFKHQRADGSICDVEVYCNPIELGGRTFLYSMVYDITERLKHQREKEELEKMLRQAQKMEAFGQLAGGIAHDFNNILSSIFGYTELAMSGIHDGDRLEEDLREILIAGQRAKELVAQILAFSRQTDEQRQCIEPGSIVKETLKLIRSTTPSTIEIKDHINPTATIQGNAVQVHQVIMNLCSNAVQAMEDGGILRLGVDQVTIPEALSVLGKELPRGDYVKLTVADTGHGIAASNLAAVFEPYYTTKPLGEGTGLGLSMVYGIVESYGGGIIASSEPSIGTIFTIYLPVGGGRPAGQNNEMVEPLGGDERILFVDDEAAIAKMGKRILEDLGYRVTIMIDSVAALEHFRLHHNSFDLVITDMTMPHLRGDKFAVELQRINPAIPVILFTGYSKKLSEESLREIGVKAFAFKPVARAELATTVRRVLDEGGP